MHDVSRVTARPARQFTLRAFFCFVLLVGALCGVITAVDTSTTAGLLTFAVAVRLLPTLVVGTVIGLLVGSISKSLVAALVGVVVADIVWRGFFSAVATSVEAQDLVLNPLVVIGLVACPPAAAKSRARALTIGISLSIVLPLMVATGILWKMPIGPGCTWDGFSGRHDRVDGARGRVDRREWNVDREASVRGSSTDAPERESPFLAQ